WQQHCRVSLVVGKIEGLKLNRFLKNGSVMALIGALGLRDFLHELIPVRALWRQSGSIRQYFCCLLRTLLEKLPTLVGNRICVSAATCHPRVLKLGIGASHPCCYGFRTGNHPALKKRKMILPVGVGLRTSTIYIIDRLIETGQLPSTSRKPGLRRAHSICHLVQFSKVLAQQ